MYWRNRAQTADFIAVGNLQTSRLRWFMFVDQVTERNNSDAESHMQARSQNFSFFSRKSIT